MKDKILIFIIGALVGAIISTGGFYIYTSNAKTTNCTTTDMRMKGDRTFDGQRGNMKERTSNENGQPPEMPNDSTNGQPPEAPSKGE